MERFREARILYLGSLLALFLFAACSAETISNDSPPEKQYEEGMRLLKRSRYTESVERFRALKSRFPYSKYAALASVKIGDAHYEEESFIESAAAYKVFRELYPKHELAAYALYRMGESNYNLMPSTSDRDLDSAHAAIDAYSQLVKDYPNSPYLDDCKQKISILRKKLADKEDYVGDFYFHRELYASAVGRYRQILEEFPESSYVEKALFRLAFSYQKIGEFTKAMETLERLELSYPNGIFKNDSAVLKTKLKKDLTKE